MVPRTFDPFAGPAISHLVPLTEAQAEIWAACQLGGDDANRAYNESVTVRLLGPLHRPALEQALAALPRRHEALRLAFGADGRCGYVVEEMALGLTYQDYTASPDPAGRAAAYLRQQAEQPFDLLRGPLLRAGLLQLGPDEHHLVLTTHHLVCDGWSIGILLQELGALYSAARRGAAAQLPAAVPFGEYADKALTFSREASYKEVEAFWLRQFAGEVPVLRLPTDGARPARRSYRAARFDAVLPPALGAGLKQVGQRAGCTFATTLLAAFEVLLHQLTGQTDLVVGLPAAGQAAQQLPRLVGHCVNLLPLRTQLDPAQSFAAYLKQRKSVLLDAYEHQRFTFGTLLKQLRLRREAGRVPLVPVVFNLDLGLADGVAFEDLRFELHSNPRAFEAFELFVNASGTEQALTLEWSYNTDLFGAATIARFMTAFSELLRRLIEQPQAPLRDLTAAPAAPNPVYHALNATSQPYPATATLGQLLAAQAAATPQAPAVEQGSTVLSYRELDQQANRLAHYLRQQGVQPGHVVGLALARTPDLLVALLACIRCGAPYLPLDPSYPAERLTFMLSDAQAQLVLASVPLPVAVATPVLSMSEARPAAANLPSTAPALELLSTSPLYVLYTSGSTGQPKGVVVSHRNVVNFLHSMQQAPGLSATDRLLATTTISFDIAGLELFLPLLSGATVVLAPTEAARDGRLLLQLLRQERITMLQATPTSWRMLLEAGWYEPLPLKALSGGEALPPDLAAQLLARCQSVWNMYGPTETTIWSTLSRVQSGEAITIGRPIANTQVYVLDERGQALGPGQTGELCIAGDGVALGYLNRPALTAERFVANHFAPQPGAWLYRTGDLGQLLPSGELQCLGRLDQQVKLRGHRIEPGEIEHALLQLPEVREAVVTVQAPRPGHERLVAHVVLTPDAPTEAAPARAARWRTELLRHLPAYMVPTDYQYLAALPRTLNGKTDRAALGTATASLPAATAPTKTAEPVEAAGYSPVASLEALGVPAHVAPRTAAEQLVTTIWQECLGSTEPVGVNDDFFSIGGHSLIAVRVMLQLERATGRRLPLAALLECPTVEKLAAMLADDQPTQGFSSLVPIKPAGSRPPLYIVHGAGLNVLIFNALPGHMHPDQPVYGLQAKGLDGVEAPLTTIEEMAAHYVAAVVAHRPSGPIALAGYSYGGIIAYEMAKQLLAAGREISFLGMLDTYAYQTTQHNSPLVNAWRNNAFQLKSLAFKGWLLLRQPSLVLRYYNPTLLRKLLEHVRYSKAERVARYEERHGHSRTVGAVYESAQEAYLLTPQPLHIHLFRNTEKAYYVDDFEHLGWREFAQRGVTVRDIPGNHFSIFDAPHAPACAQAMQQALDACTAPAAS